MGGKKDTPTHYCPSYKIEFPWADKDEKCNTNVFCNLCEKVIDIRSMGRTALVSHAKGIKHCQRLKSQTANMKIGFFLNRDADTSTSAHSNLEKNSENRPVNLDVSNQENVEKFLLKKEVAKAEILWCLNAVAKHFSNRGAAEAASIFPNMFPDSKIAKNMKLQKDKIGYTITYGIARYFSAELKDVLKFCKFFVVGFDESLNKISQKKQMDLVVRFWDNTSNEVSTRYFSSVFLESASATDLKNGLTSAVGQENLRKILQISMDGPPVNFCMLDDLRLHMKQKFPEYPILLDWESCGLHNIHGAFKTGMKKTNWNIQLFLTCLYRLFKDSPARRGDFTKVTSSGIFPKKFFDIRWVENLSVASRALIMVPTLRIWIKKVENEGKKNVLNENHYNFKVVSEFVEDPLLEAKLAFFKSVASLVEPFHVKYQSDAPLAPFLYRDLTYLITTVMERFIQPNVLEKATSVSDVDLTNPKIMLSVADTDIGFETKGVLAALRPKISFEKITNFKTYARQCYLTLTQKLMDKCPLKYGLTKAISSLDPKVILDSPTAARKRFSNCLEILSTENKWISGIKADKIKLDFKELCKLTQTKDELKTFDFENTRLDNFWINLISNSGNAYEDLTQLIKMILILSHGNAALERGFSVNEDCLVENQKEESLIALRIVYDKIKVSGGVKSVPITEELIKSASNAYNVYVQAKESKAAANKKALEEKQAKKRKFEKTKELENQKRKILKEATEKAQILQGEIDNLKRR